MKEFVESVKTCNGTTKTIIFLINVEDIPKMITL